MITKIGKSFEDKRGAIIDIITDINFDSLTRITFNSGSVRGEHFHKDTIQYNYLLTGSLTYRTRTSNSGSIDEYILLPGDMIVSHPGQHHAFKATEYAELLCITAGPRKGFDYEKDTFRLSSDQKLFNDEY